MSNSDESSLRVKRSTLWGRFMTLEEAKQTSGGNGGIELWKFQDHLGRSVADLMTTTSLEGVPDMDRPVFVSDNGWMYIGNWVERNGDWLEMGFGCSISCVKGSSYEGLCYVGNHKFGERHGDGKRFWLQDSKVWKENRVTHSPLEDPKTKELIPFNYEGQFHYNDYYDKAAIVELADGTRRKGEWKHGTPYGDFFKDHELLA